MVWSITIRSSLRQSLHLNQAGCDFRPEPGPWLTTGIPQDAAGGHINIAWMNSLIDGNPPLVAGQPANILEASQPLTQAKGGAWLSDFATFANTLGAATVICFNGFTDTNPGSATLMAQAARGLGLNVVEWELANEAYLYPLIFPTAAAYATAMYDPYFTGIASASPAATIGLFLAGLFPGNANNYSAWDSGLSSYTPPGARYERIHQFLCGSDRGRQYADLYHGIELLFSGWGQVPELPV